MKPSSVEKGRNALKPKRTGSAQVEGNSGWILEGHLSFAFQSVNDPTRKWKKGEPIVRAKSSKGPGGDLEGAMRFKTEGKEQESAGLRK